MSESGAPARTVVVEPLSTRKETLLVARTVFHIFFWAALLIALERAAGTGRSAVPIAEPATAVAPRPLAMVGELAAAGLDPQDRAIFSVVRSAAAALEKERGRTGAWPPADALPSPEPGAYRWKMLHEAVVTEYAAVPAATSGRSTFLIVFVEPEPGVPSDPQAVTDEIHHRLPDGALLHVMIWKAPDARDVTRVLANPAPEDGWRRITGSAR